MAYGSVVVEDSVIMLWKSLLASESKSSAGQAEEREERVVRGRKH